jgi:hypothetical protein
VGPRLLHALGYGGLAIAIVIALVGWGGATGSKARVTAPTAAAATTTSPTSTQTADFQIEKGALVTLRAFSDASLLWQAVSLAPDGKGLLTTLIGEVSGAEQRRFRLSPPQAALMRRLVAAVRTVRAPAPNGNPRDMLYTLYISGRPSVDIQGRAPKQLTALINFLSGLMMSECC